MSLIESLLEIEGGLTRDELIKAIGTVSLWIEDWKQKEKKFRSRYSV